MFLYYVMLFVLFIAKYGGNLRAKNPTATEHWTISMVAYSLHYHKNTKNYSCWNKCWNRD